MDVIFVNLHRNSLNCEMQFINDDIMRLLSSFQYKLTKFNSLSFHETIC